MKCYYEFCSSTNTITNPLSPLYGFCVDQAEAHHRLWADKTFSRKDEDGRQILSIPEMQERLKNMGKKQPELF